MTLFFGSIFCAMAFVDMRAFLGRRRARLEAEWRELDAWWQNLVGDFEW